MAQGALYKPTALPHCQGQHTYNSLNTKNSNWWWGDTVGLRRATLCPGNSLGCWISMGPLWLTTHLNGTQSHHWKTCLATREGQLVEALSPPLLGILIRIIFIRSRKFPVHWVFPPPRNAAPNDSHLSLYALSPSTLSPFNLISTLLSPPAPICP